MTKEEIYNLTKEDFYNLCKEYQKKYKKWRWGQTVFNVADNLGYARKIQFEKNVDCFYNDSEVEKFVDILFELIEEEILSN